MACGRSSWQNKNVQSFSLLPRLHTTLPGSCKISLPVELRKRLKTILMRCTVASPWRERRQGVMKWTPKDLVHHVCLAEVRVLNLLQTCEESTRNPSVTRESLKRKHRAILEVWQAVGGIISSLQHIHVQGDSVTHTHTHTMVAPRSLRFPRASSTSWKTAV